MVDTASICNNLIFSNWHKYCLSHLASWIDCVASIQEVDLLSLPAVFMIFFLKCKLVTGYFKGEYYAFLKIKKMVIV